MLVDYFIEKFAERFGKNIKSVTQEAMELMKNYSWPGNVRELENIVERMIALEGDSASLMPSALPVQISEPLKPRFDSLSQELVWKAAGVNLDEIIARVEREFILKALEQSKGVKKEAARLLAISLRSIRYRMEKFDMENRD